MKLPDSIGKLGSGTECIKDIGLDPVCGKTERRNIGKLGRFSPAVISYGHSFVRGTHLFDIVCQSLGSLSDRIYVHPVETGSYDSSKSSRSKLQFLVEPVLYLSLIPLDAL